MNITTTPQKAWKDMTQAEKHLEAIASNNNPVVSKLP